MDRILNIGLLSLKGQWGLLVLIIPIFYKYVVKKTKIRSIRNIWTAATGWHVQGNLLKSYRFYRFFVNVNVLFFYFHFLQRMLSHPFCYSVRNDNYCFPGKRRPSNQKSYWKKSWRLKLVLCGFLLPRMHLLLQSYIELINCN